MTILLRCFFFLVWKLRPVSTPATDYISEGEPADLTLFRQIVGSLMHLMVVSRPDIAFAVGRLARKMQGALASDLVAAKRVLRYLRGSVELSLRYSRGGELCPLGSADSAFADDTKTRRSTGGHDFFLCGGPVIWRSGLQKLLTLSTAESEYVQLSNATRDAAWLKTLLLELGIVTPPIVIEEDNTAAIQIASNPITSQRTKHIDLRYHFVRQAVQLKTIVLKQVPTEEQKSDLHTKPLTKSRFLKLRARFLS